MAAPRAEPAPSSEIPTPAKSSGYSPFDKIEKGLVAGDIANAEDGYQYIYTPAKDYAGAPAALVDWRLKMRARGFEPITGPEYRGSARPEYHASEPSAEIWRRPSHLRDDEWRAQLAALCLDNRHFAYYHKRHPGESPWLTTRLRDAMYERHGLKGDGKGPRNTPEIRATIINLCRRMKVHPGVTED